MTQEDKQLLLADLCSRLPYGVMVKVVGTNNPPEKVLKIGMDLPNPYITTETWAMCYPLDVRPYLRPMSSMTEEEFESLKEYSGLKYEQLDLASYQNGTYKCLDFYLSEVPSYVVILVFDWLNTHHFDYRGLIERELAIAVTEENNPYK